MNQPTVLVLATSPEGAFLPLPDPSLVRMGKTSLLERHLDTLVGFGCSRFVVVGSAEARPAMERLSDEGARSLRFVQAPKNPGGLAWAFVASEPALSHFASGPVLVTQPEYVVDASLYGDLLTAWSKRKSGVEGIVATMEGRPSLADGLQLLLRQERIVGCVSGFEVLDEAKSVQFAGAMLYSSSRELCETIGDEAGKAGSRDAVARGLNRLMAWNDLRAFPYSGPIVRLSAPEDLSQLLDAKSLAKAEAIVDEHDLDRVHRPLEQPVSERHSLSTKLGLSAHTRRADRNQ